MRPYVPEPDRPRRFEQPWHVTAIAFLFGVMGFAALLSAFFTLIVIGLVEAGLW